MKTIADLNANWWYRGMKVVYLVFVLCCIGFAVSSVVMLFVLVRENSQSYTKELASYQDQLNGSPERVAFIQDLKDKGYTTKEITQEVSVKYHGGTKYGMPVLTRIEYEAIYGQEVADSSGMGLQEPKPEFPSSMKWFFLSIPASILICWFVIEAPRRVFYYVVLGSIRPKKNESNNLS